MSEIVGLAIIAIFPVCMVFATFFDIFTMTIPNKLTLILLAAFIILAPLAGMEWLQMAKHFGVAAVVLSVCFFCFAMGWMGAGDAKLLTVSGLWFGPTEVLVYVFLGGILGGFLTLAVIGMRMVPLPERVSNVPWLMRLHDKKEGVPYGAALGPAALFLFMNSPWCGLCRNGGVACFHLRAPTLTAAPTAVAVRFPESSIRLERPAPCGPFSCRCRA